MNKNVIVFGPPNSGKGTQVELLVKKLNAELFSAGDTIRQETESGSDLGKEFQKFTSTGELIPNELLEKSFVNKINSIKDKQIVFDGFPRSLDQIEIFEKLSLGRDYIVLNINVSDESLMVRMEKRRVCAKCGKIFVLTDPNAKKSCDECGGELERREDDKPDVLRNRLKVYAEETEPALEHFRKLGKVIDINGEPAVEVVEKEIWDKVNAED